MVYTFRYWFWNGEKQQRYEYIVGSTIPDKISLRAVYPYVVAEMAENPPPNGESDKEEE